MSFYLLKSQSLVPQTFSPISNKKTKKKKIFKHNSLRESLIGSASSRATTATSKTKKKLWFWGDTSNSFEVPLAEKNLAVI